jgi:hypothetical protein
MIRDLCAAEEASCRRAASAPSTLHAPDAVSLYRARRSLSRRAALAGNTSKPSHHNDPASPSNGRTTCSDLRCR